MLYRDNVHVGRTGYQAPGSRSLTQVRTNVRCCHWLPNLSEGRKSLINILTHYVINALLSCVFMYIWRFLLKEFSLTDRFQSVFSLLQPIGIEKIAAKKGKVYGDTHDSHRWTKEQLEELNVRHSWLFYHWQVFLRFFSFCSLTQRNFSPKWNHNHTEYGIIFYIALSCKIFDSDWLRNIW